MIHPDWGSLTYWDQVEGAPRNPSDEPPISSHEMADQLWKMLERHQHSLAASWPLPRPKAKLLALELAVHFAAIGTSLPIPLINSLALLLELDDDVLADPISFMLVSAAGGKSAHPSARNTAMWLDGEYSRRNGGEQLPLLVLQRRLKRVLNGLKAGADGEGEEPGHNPLADSDEDGSSEVHGADPTLISRATLRRWRAQPDYAEFVAFLVAEPF